MRTIRTSIVLVLLAGLAAAGAFANGEKEGSPAAAAGAPRTEGPIAVSVGSSGIGKINFNPFAPGTTSVARNLMYEPLMVFDTAQGPKEYPWLATGYRIAPDCLSVTFDLRKGVKWNDDQPFTADDVVFTFETVAKFPAMDRYAVLPYFKSIEKKDSHTVTILMKKPSSLAHFVFGVVNMLPRHAWADVADPATYLNDKRPVATGPFTEVEKAEVNVLTVLKKNPHYWMPGKPMIDGIAFPHNRGEANDFALINGDVHWGNSFIPDVENTYVKASAFNHTSDGDNGMQVLLFMNHARPVTGDLAFRQAVSQAINYKQVLDVVFYGKSQMPQPTGLSAPFHGAWLNPKAAAKAKEMGLGVHDPARARKTLDAAGYKDVDGDGLREGKDGKPLKLAITVVGNFTDFVGTVQIIQQNLQAVGVKVDINAVDMGQAFGAMMSGNFDMGIWFGTMAYSPWNFYRNQLDGDLITERGALGENFARWKDARTDKLLADFVKSTDLKAQKAALDELQLLYASNVINVPVFTRFTTSQYNDSVFTGFPTNADYYASSGPAMEAARLLVLTRLRYKGKK